MVGFVFKVKSYWVAQKFTIHYITQGSLKPMVPLLQPVIALKESLVRLFVFKGGAGVKSAFCFCLEDPSLVLSIKVRCLHLPVIPALGDVAVSGFCKHMQT